MLAFNTNQSFKQAGTTQSRGTFIPSQSTGTVKLVPRIILYPPNLEEQ
jgi:hypothetical protein